MKIGLALSGGGVLGIAHVGLLAELEKNEIRIDKIAGTSAGAIIGLLYADGGTKEVDTFIDDLRTAGLFHKNSLRFALPDKIFKQIKISLEKTVKSRNFDDLTIDFCCIATDFADGKPVILDKGDVIDAVMASCAYPGFFKASEIEGRSLIDGGISRNLPASILRKRKADFVIGSSLYHIARLKQYDVADQNPNRIETVIRALDIMQKELAELELRNCDFRFVPPVEEFRWFHFDKMEEIRKVSANYARKRIEELKVELQQASEKVF